MVWNNRWSLINAAVEARSIIRKRHEHAKRNRNRKFAKRPCHYEAKVPFPHLIVVDSRVWSILYSRGRFLSFSSPIRPKAVYFSRDVYPSVLQSSIYTWLEKNPRACQISPLFIRLLSSSASCLHIFFTTTTLYNSYEGLLWDFSAGTRERR